jgi:hypothetical protein
MLGQTVALVPTQALRIHPQIMVGLVHMAAAAAEVMLILLPVAVVELVEQILMDMAVVVVAAVDLPLLEEMAELED